MKRLYILLMLILPFALYAGEEELGYVIPDFDAIEKDVNEPSSHYYYPKLFKRFCDGDTTMTPVELERVYYGFSFQEDFEAYRDVK